MSHASNELVSIPCGLARMEGMLELPDNPLGVVLFAHGSGSSRLSPRNNYVARVLRDARIGTFLLDLLTRQEDNTYQNRFNIDLLTQRLGIAADWLRAHPATAALPLGLFGASTGAAAALQLAASGGAGIAAVVARGGRPDLAGRQALETVHVPTLLLVGGDDDGVLELNRAAYAALPCPKRLVVVPGATHLFEEPGTLEQVAALASEWFVQHFPQQ